ncbi:MAG: hypothetical protein CMF38_00580 [Legionellaceae bacterium]|nr:hypothetical protein [Legionellaceae bacterium]HAF87707.1 hypothetical protein [Legionellales bacterium]HCA88977.1 hypothetical protein [Legionellales bacterium]|tara:strand:+ start:1639 stop:1932 length:294 start_codon:yes stop_codon:yes gene_type:complete
MDVILCPKCQQTVRENQTLCPQCGHNLAPHTSSQAHVPSTSSKTSRLHLILAGAVCLTGLYNLFFKGAILSGILITLIGAMWFVVARVIMIWKNLFK